MSISYNDPTKRVRTTFSRWQYPTDRYDIYYYLAAPFHGDCFRIDKDYASNAIVIKLRDPRYRSLRRWNHVTMLSIHMARDGWRTWIANCIRKTRKELHSFRAHSLRLESRPDQTAPNSPQLP